jgi:hypothetical protein
MSGKYENIQGVINAKVSRLYFDDNTKLLNYVKTLSDKQKERARQHLKTVLAIKSKNENRSY